MSPNLCEFLSSNRREFPSVPGEEEGHVDAGRPRKHKPYAGGRFVYRANEADYQAWESVLRPKSCLLAIHVKLQKIVASKLNLDWSPEQVSGWLKIQYRDDEGMRVSHATIYRTAGTTTAASHDPLTEKRKLAADTSNRRPKLASRTSKVVAVALANFFQRLALLYSMTWKRTDGRYDQAPGSASRGKVTLHQNRAG
jgi:hypothetical protein